MRTAVEGEDEELLHKPTEQTFAGNWGFMPSPSGTALLEHAFAEFQRRGRTRAGLGVDAENLSGAGRLYERAGMRVVRNKDTWERAL